MWKKKKKQNIDGKMEVKKNKKINKLLKTGKQNSIKDKMRKRKID